MKSLNALDAKNRFGELSELVQREPVQITKHGRPAWVAISVEDFKTFESLDTNRRKDAIAALRAAQTQAAQANLSETEKAELIGHDS